VAYSARQRAKPGKRAQEGYPGQAAHTGQLGLSPDTRNKRSVWTVGSEPFKEANFATYPPALIEPCILAGCPKGGTVLDPFGGAGTTGLVADRLGRNAVLIELNPEYAALAQRRLEGDAGML
jgi:DNA modification methylase